MSRQHLLGCLLCSPVCDCQVIELAPRNEMDMYVGFGVYGMDWTMALEGLDARSERGVSLPTLVKQALARNMIDHR